MSITNHFPVTTIKHQAMTEKKQVPNKKVTNNAKKARVTSKQ